MRGRAHETSPKTYAKVLLTLMMLTVITVVAAGFDFGSANVVIALVIATIKASLVAMFFMHLLHDKPMNSLIFVSGLVFLAIFLMLTLLDADTRPAIERASPQKPVTGYSFPDFRGPAVRRC
jgi:cytochrome c oxidase subunit 4